MSTEYIIIDDKNIDQYKALLFEVLKNINPKQSLQIMRSITENIKGKFPDHIRLSNYSFTRGLEVNGERVALATGFIRYFSDGTFCQIGFIGVTRKHQRKGYARLFLKNIEEELKSLGVNYVWCMPKDYAFWLKVGFVKGSKDMFMGRTTSITPSDKVVQKKLNEEVLGLENFLYMFDEDKTIQVEYIPEIHPNIRK